MTSFPFLDDYSSEDYDDCDDYCIVPEVSQTTHPTHETNNINEALSLMIERPEVTTPRSNQQVIFSRESNEDDDDDNDDEVPNMDLNEVAESESTAIIPTGAPATSNRLAALRVIDWTREGTRIPIQRRQDLDTMMWSGSSSPAFMCGTILKSWIEQFLFKVARFRIRFYHSIAAAFRKVTSWVTRWATRKQE